MTASRDPIVTKNHVAEHQRIVALVHCLASRANLWDLCEQHSSSHQSPVGNREHTCRCQAVIIVREPCSSQFPFSQRVRSMKGVYLAMLKSEKAEVWQTRQEDSWLLMLLCDGFQESCCYQESRCGTLSKFCHLGRTSTCPSSMSRQSCQLMGHWCHNPVPINHRCRTASTHLQVSSIDHSERTTLFTVSICTMSGQ